MWQVECQIAMNEYILGELLDVLLPGAEVVIYLAVCSDSPVVGVRASFHTPAAQNTSEDVIIYFTFVSSSASSGNEGEPTNPLRIQGTFCCYD